MALLMVVEVKNHVAAPSAIVLRDRSQVNDNSRPLISNARMQELRAN